MRQTNTCIDKEIYAILKSIDYSFSGSAPEKRKIYEDHLKNCSYCREQKSKIKKKKRQIGFGMLIGGLIISFTSLLPILFADAKMDNVILFTFGFGLILSFKGVLQFIRGKSFEQK